MTNSRKVLSPEQVVEGTVSVPMWAVMYRDEEMGVAQRGYFASDAYISDEYAYDQVSGRKFGWIDAKGAEWCEDKNHMNRPTQEQWDDLDENIKADLILIQKEQ